MKTKDTKPARSKAKKRTASGQTGQMQKRVRMLVQREYLFNATPVLITPPRHLYTGPVVRGSLAGSWKVAATSLSELAVTAMDARLYPRLSLILQGKGKKELVIGRDPIPLKLATFKLPPHLRSHFGQLNIGTFDRKSRFVSTTIGFRATDKSLGNTLGVFQTFGFVNEQGLLISGGTALILTGLFAGTILCCCSPRPPVPTPPPPPLPAPPTCAARAVARDSGPTSNGKEYTDFSKFLLNDGGTSELIPKGPTAENELGFVQGSYFLPPGTKQGNQGRFKKIEIEVTAAAPCSIVSVDRTMTRRKGHDIEGDDHPPNEPDAVKEHSIAVRTPQRWLISDAPGFIAKKDRTANRTFHKKYTVTATIQQGTVTFTRTATYIVLIRTDANGNIIPKPTPP